MEEMMKCPACAEEIPVGTKKCNYCNEELEKQCPCCREWIIADAKRCKHCGTWLNKFIKEQFEGKAPTSEAESSDGYVGVRAFIYIELGIITYLLCEMMEWSWWIFAAIGFVNILLLTTQFYRVIYAIAVSAIWGLVGLSLAPLFMDESDFEIEMRMMTDNFGDYWWVALIFFASSLFIHAAYMTKEK